MAPEESARALAIEKAFAARETLTLPTGTCSSKEIADYYGIARCMVSDAAKHGSIPSARKVLDRWVFNFREAIEGWTPAVVQRLEEGLPLVGGREPDGPFAKGNTIGLGARSGRTKRAVERRFMKKLTDEVSEEDWAGIIRKAVDQALQGDYRARSWLSHYLIGKPVERILAAVDVGGQRFSIAERAVAVEELLTHLARQEKDVIEGEAVVAGPDTTPE